jgi:hypothetical protein
MNIVYLVKRPLLPRDFDRYGVGFMLDRGHRVTVLDVSQPCHPEMDNSQAGVVGDPRLDLRIVADWNGLRRERQVLAQADMVFFLLQSYGHSRMILPALTLLRRLGTPFLIMAPTMLAGGAPRIEELPLARALKEAWGRFRFADPLNSLIARLPPGWLGVRPADAVVYSSVKAMRPNSLVGPATRHIYTHTADYETFRQIRDRQMPRLDQAVFIDQWLPFHPDFKVGRTVWKVDPTAYYGQLDRLFARVEREIGLEVVLAGHPRGDYAAYPDLFKRRVVVGQTAELIAQSKLVLGHYSTAFGLAAAFRIPVMVLAERSLYDMAPNIRHNLNSFAEDFSTRVHFLDQADDIDLSRALDFDPARYQAYVDTYMCHPKAPDQPPWEAIARAVEGG